MSSVNNVIRMDEVRKHEGDNENVWLVIHDKVYDVSAFLEDVSIQMKYRDELKLGCEKFPPILAWLLLSKTGQPFVHLCIGSKLHTKTGRYMGKRF